jgi:hypothetical protein
MILKTFTLLLLFALCLGLISAMAQTPDPHMTAEERAKLIKLLKDSQAETLALVEKLSDEQWKFKPAPEKWSVGECVEHIMMAEGALFANVEKALAAKENPAWAEQTKGKTEFLERVMPSRTGRAQAPEAIVPTGKVPRAELLKQLRDARAKTLKFAEAAKAPLKSHTAEHPFPVFNTLNAYQWVIYIPLHNQRHNKQIEEVRAHPNFPKN